MIAGPDAVPPASDAMIVLTLPDGATREVPAGTLARDVVGSIGARLLRDRLDTQSLRENAYWEPVVWEEVPEICP